jgi:hypothetical protein
MLKRGWQVVWVFACLGCGGDLRDPGRFAGLFEDDGGLTTGNDAGGTSTRDAASKDTGTTAPIAMPIDPAPTCVVDVLKKCDSVACHGQGATMVNLVAAGVEKRLVDQPSSNASVAACKGRTLVATDGSESLLLDKLSGTPPCGAAMPIGFELEDDEVECLTDWVESLND